MNQNLGKSYLRRIGGGEISFSDFDTLSSFFELNNKKEKK